MATATKTVNRDAVRLMLARVKFTELVASHQYHNNGELPDDESLTRLAETSVVAVLGKADPVLSDRLLAGG